MGMLLLLIVVLAFRRCLIYKEGGVIKHKIKPTGNWMRHRRRNTKSIRRIKKYGYML